MQSENLQVYNTLTGKKEKFMPLVPGKVGMYVCGPTTYNFIHLGNARPLVVFDTIRRYLEYLGYEVTYIQNFTDVDDKIINRAREEGVNTAELAGRYVREYFQDADALQVKRATMHPKVSEHMGDIIRFIQGLADKGHAYEVDGDVYFSVTSFPEYGKLSKRTPDDLMAGIRVEIDERKKDPSDFALWKKAKPGEPSWESPWGAGRPGWHIECSTMSHKYLGRTFDIHGGGFDLVFPHHENEIAQSEGLHGQPMARYWMHNGFITVNQEKMSKSLGNFFLVRDIVQKFPPEVVRFYLLSTHYRSPLDFDDEKLTAAQRGLERLQTADRLATEFLNSDTGMQENAASPEGLRFQEETESLSRQFKEAMNDDFNSALAIAALFEMARSINSFLTGGVTGREDRELLRQVVASYRELASILGLRLESQDRRNASGLADALVELVVQIRESARIKKDFKTADEIRESLKQLGIILEDTPQGVRWRMNNS